MADLEWTSERVERLKTLWAKGFSASQISCEIPGASRSAIIGKVHRLKLPARKERASPLLSAGNRPAPRPRPRQPSSITNGFAPLAIAERAKPALPARDTFPVAIDDAPLKRSEIWKPTGAGIKLTALEIDTCRWPLGDPASEEFEYCGKPSARKPKARIGDGDCFEPYCAHHCRLAYQPRTERERARQAERDGYLPQRARS